MLKFKHFLILEQGPTLKDSIKKEITDILVKINDPNVSSSEKESLKTQLKNKTDEMKTVKVTETSTTKTSAPNPPSLLAKPDSNEAPFLLKKPSTEEIPEFLKRDTLSTLPQSKDMKDSAFDSIMKGEKPQNIPTPEITDNRDIRAIPGLGSLGATPRQTLGTETLGKFSKSFYRI